jgi:hypothetical protein
MDVLDELRLFREKRLSNSTFCTPVSYSNLNMNLNLNLKLESETVERIVQLQSVGGGGGTNNKLINTHLSQLVRPSCTTEFLLQLDTKCKVHVKRSEKAQEAFAEERVK